MKAVLRLIRRNGIFYSFHNATGKRESLATRNRNEAMAMLAAKAQSVQQPVLNLKMARVYLSASDPRAVKRTWREVLECLIQSKKAENRARWERMDKHAPFNSLWNKIVIETMADDFWYCLNAGTVTTNKFLRVLHNFAVDMDLLQHRIIPKKLWPTLEYGPKRAITSEEHSLITEREMNLERKAFYQLAWATGAAQTDLANLTAERIDWKERRISFFRKKTKTPVHLFFGEDTAEILKLLPDKGPLFPYLKTVRAADRATEFKQRCDGLKIRGVTLHSYRYAWAERAQKAGYPERFAMLALGHNSTAVHRAYAKGAEVSLPPLEDYEKAAAERKIISFPFQQKALDVEASQGKTVQRAGLPGSGNS